MVGLSFSVEENQAFYVPIPQDPEEAQKIVNEFKSVYEDERILKIGQNIKYDLMVLQNYGITLKGEIFDTMIAHYLLQPELRHGMDYLAEVYLNYQTIHIEELIGPKGKNQKNMADLPPSQVYEYACEDADITLKLKNVFEPKLKEEGCYDLFREVEMPLMPVLAWMERNGVCIDTEALKETSTLYTKEMNRLEEEIHALAGEPFNIASPKQVGEVLFEKLKISEKPKKTKTGQYVTSEEVLETLRTRHPIVEKILEHRGLKKLLGTYIDALPKLINPETGHIHTSFNQTITTTGRLSSSNPNLQNIPVRNEEGKEIRKAFIPEPGCEFFSADYSQIELRIMAHLSGDPHMIEAFREGYDIHAATAAKIYKKPLEEVTREERSKAKTANFGIIYGITVFGLAERMNVSRAEAKELIDGYFITYPKVKEYMQKSIETAREKGYTETIYHFPDETIVRTDDELPSLDNNNNLKTYLNYIYKDKLQTFYSSLRMNRSMSENDDWNRQRYNNTSAVLVKQEYKHTVRLNPALQLRYNRTLPKRQILRLELYGSYGNNDYNRWYEQRTDEVITSSYANATAEDSWYGRLNCNYSKSCLLYTSPSPRDA